MKKFLFIVLYLLATPLTALAAAQSIPTYFSYIFNTALAASGLLVLVQIAVGAVQMMLNASNPGAQSAGKERIKNALLGMALIFGSWLILWTINPDFVNFNDPINAIQQKGDPSR